jgi:hypothetical protein
MLPPFLESQQPQGRDAALMKPLQEPTRKFDDDIGGIYMAELRTHDPKQAKYNCLNTKRQQINYLMTLMFLKKKSLSKYHLNLT